MYESKKKSIESMKMLTFCIDFDEKVQRESVSGHLGTFFRTQMI